MQIMNIVLALCLMLLSSPTFAWDTSNIIDDPNFIEVDDKMENIPPEFKRIAKSIGRVSMSCTATHIGKGLALTAGHCLRASESVEYDQSCEGITIRWGYRGSKKKRLKSKCLRILVMQNKPGADYALLE